jgi:hypothetical protein
VTADWDPHEAATLELAMEVLPVMLERDGYRDLEIWLEGEKPDTRLWIRFSTTLRHPAREGRYAVSVDVWEGPVEAPDPPYYAVYTSMFVNMMMEDISRVQLPSTGTDDRLRLDPETYEWMRDDPE